MDPSTVAFSREAFRALLRSEFVEVTDRVATALRDVEVPALDHAPDLADAWVFGLYSSILARLPDPAGLLTHAASLRSGGSPEALAHALVASEEGVHSGAIEPQDLDEVFVIGAYLVVLGRAPETSGLEQHREILRNGNHTREQIIDGLMASEEARHVLRFPPPPLSRSRLVAEAVQVVLLSREPDPEITRLLGAAYAGLGTRRLAKVLLRRDRRIRGIVRSFFVTRGVARAIEVEATARGAYLETLASRRWQWRVDRSTWNRTTLLERQIENARDACDRATGASPPSPPGGDV